MLLVIIIMVKNEADNLPATLSNYVKAGLKHFLVFDTGSTDNTVSLATSFFQQQKLHGYVYQEKFIDFAASRNRTLETAERLFPNAAFFLMPDAEWQLQNVSALIDFCRSVETCKIPLYSIKVVMNQLAFYTARLFRAASKNRFVGAVHEVPNTIATEKVPANSYFNVVSSHHGRQKSRRRWQDDLILLTNAYTTNTTDSRTLFYLAQTYECLDDLPNAYHHYQLRAELKGWQEENFITQLRLGLLAEKIFGNQPENFHIAMNHYLAAHAICSHRIEPLIKIADHYWPYNIPTCYLFIRRAYEAAYPNNDVLFVEKEMYDYTRYEIMSRCAWYMGEYELGKTATLRALQVHPEADHLQKNLKIYEAALMKATVAPVI